MSLKFYQFYCGNCGYKRFTKGDDIQDLIEVKTSPIPRGSPQLDPLAKKTMTPAGINQPAIIATGITTPPSIKQCKKFKCPKCGFVIKAKQLKEQDYEQTNKPDGCESGSEGQSIPSEPI